MSDYMQGYENGYADGQRAIKERDKAAAAIEAKGPRCQLPPDGWMCTRKAGHEGPCAAHPVRTYTLAGQSTAQ